MESNGLVALRCLGCGASLSTDLTCEFCKLRHMQVQYPPQGEDDLVAMPHAREDAHGVYECGGPYLCDDEWMSWT